MTGLGATVAANLRWELRRLVRSQRIFLLIIPPVAGPIGSAVADLYLRVPSAATAEILGLLVTGGLAALILLDLTALTVGEDLVRRAHLATFALPQDRRVALGARLLVAVGGPLAGYLLGAGLIAELGGRLVTASALANPPLFDPTHLLVALVGLLIALAGVTALGAVVTRSSSEALVAGILAGVVVAGGVGYLVALREASMIVPLLLGIGGLAALGAAAIRYPSVAE